ADIEDARSSAREFSDLSQVVISIGCSSLVRHAKRASCQRHGLTAVNRPFDRSDGGAPVGLPSCGFTDRFSIHNLGSRFLSILNNVCEAAFDATKVQTTN